MLNEKTVCENLKFIMKTNNDNEFIIYRKKNGAKTQVMKNITKEKAIKLFDRWYIR